MKDAAVEMGKGPVITIVDSSGRGLIANRKVVQWLRDTADTHSIPVQVEVSYGRNYRCYLHPPVPWGCPEHDHQSSHPVDSFSC